ncbi:MAG: hydrolase [Bacillota bacterium]|nr:hydrolase [Bacillota bacterium]
MHTHTLLIGTGKIIHDVVVLGELTIERPRLCNPAKLEATVSTGQGFEPQLGDTVSLYQGATRRLFTGIIFEITPEPEKREARILAYCQMRYLKNKETYVIEGQRLDQVLAMIAADFRLRTGKLPNTGYVIPSLVADAKTLADTLQQCIDETYQHTGHAYAIHDDGSGLLQLKRADAAFVNHLIAADTCTGVDYSISIDGETYNRVKLYRENKESGRREIYQAQDSSTMNRWGVLQLLEKVDENVNAQVKADTQLRLYNQPQRRLGIKGLIGHPDIWGGSLLPVDLTVDDTALRGQLMVEKATHRIKDGHHTVDLALIGGGFSA